MSRLLYKKKEARTGAMCARGHFFEPLAVQYSKVLCQAANPGCNVNVLTIGMVLHQDIPSVHFSPDAVLCAEAPDGSRKYFLVEAKAPSAPRYHLERIAGGKAEGHPKSSPVRYPTYGLPDGHPGPTWKRGPVSSMPRSRPRF